MNLNFLKNKYYLCMLTPRSKSIQKKSYQPIGITRNDVIGSRFCLSRKKLNFPYLLKLFYYLSNRFYFGEDESVQHSIDRLDLIVDGIVDSQG